MAKKEYVDSVAERIDLLNHFHDLSNFIPIVHGINTKSIFKNVLLDGAIKIPSNHKTKKQTLLSEKIVGTDDCIYLSLGFVYAVTYDFKYNLLFDLDLLESLDYYWLSVNFQCFKAVVKYWEKYDRDYLDALGDKNRKCQAVLDYYYFKESKNRARRLFKYWEIEKDFLDHLLKYKHKTKLFTLIKKTKEKYYKKYPFSKRHALKKYQTDDTPEILSFKDLSLFKGNFKGFYIKGNIPADIKKILKKDYSDKFLFDGNKIIKIIDLK